MISKTTPNLFTSFKFSGGAFTPTGTKSGLPKNGNTLETSQQSKVNGEACSVLVSVPSTDEPKNSPAGSQTIKKESDNSPVGQAGLYERKNSLTDASKTEPSTAPAPSTVTTIPPPTNPPEIFKTPSKGTPHGRKRKDSEPAVFGKEARGLSVQTHTILKKIIKLSDDVLNGYPIPSVVELERLNKVVFNAYGGKRPAECLKEVCKVYELASYMCKLYTYLRLMVQQGKFPHLKKEHELVYIEGYQAEIEKLRKKMESSEEQGEVQKKAKN